MFSGRFGSAQNNGPCFVHSRSLFSNVGDVNGKDVL